MPYVKNKIVVNVPKRSGYDKSNRHSGTILPGTITPLLFDELIPNTRISLRINLAAQLPPLVSDTYMNAKLKVEAFFVPMRICCRSFEDFFCDFPRRIFLSSSASTPQAAGSLFVNCNAAVPAFRITYQGVPLGPGSLTDYLGVKIKQPTAALSTPIDLSVMPYIAYHLCWQEYYRNPRVQNPAFAPDLGILSDQSAVIRGASLPYSYFHRDLSVGGISRPDNSVIPIASSSQYNDMSCADGVSIFALRQRNFGLDYFTGARLSAQQGQPAAVSFTVPITGTDDGSGNVTGSGSGSISIAQIRAQNSLQQFRERENIPSPRMTDQVRARYNANLADGVAQRPIVVGVACYDISTRGIDQTSPAGSAVVGQNSNPFSNVGAQYGRGFGAGSDSIIDNFVANEPGYLLVNLTLVPEVTYSSGTPKLFTRYLSDGSITDMACSLLQNVGDQPIMVSELHENGYSPGGSVFGYQDRYADFMFMMNRASGKFRDGENLDSFLLQRSFGIGPSLNTQFLQIPTTYFDQVFQVTSQTSGIGCWFDAMLDYKVSMPLAEFSIPSLQDPAYEHGEHIVLRRNGQVF